MMRKITGECRYNGECEYRLPVRAKYLYKDLTLWEKILGGIILAVFVLLPLGLMTYGVCNQIGDL